MYDSISGVPIQWFEIYMFSTRFAIIHNSIYYVNVELYITKKLLSVENAGWVSSCSIEVEFRPELFQKTINLITLHLASNLIQIKNKKIKIHSRLYNWLMWLISIRSDLEKRKKKIKVNQINFPPLELISINNLKQIANTNVTSIFIKNVFSSTSYSVVWNKTWYFLLINYLSV